MSAAVHVALPRGEETGEIIGAWLERISLGHYPFIVTSPAAFDIGLIEQDVEVFSFTSITSPAHSTPDINQQVQQQAAPVLAKSRVQILIRAERNRKC